MPLEDYPGQCGAPALQLTQAFSRGVQKAAPRHENEVRGVWLIESAELGLDRSYWLTCYLGELTYSADANDAIGFSRREDAIKMLDHKFFQCTSVRVVEHTFV